MYFTTTTSLPLPLLYHYFTTTLPLLYHYFIINSPLINSTLIHACPLPFPTLFPPPRLQLHSLAPTCVPHRYVVPTTIARSKHIRRALLHGRMLVASSWLLCLHYALRPVFRINPELRRLLETAIDPATHLHFGSSGLLVLWSSLTARNHKIQCQW